MRNAVRFQSELDATVYIIREEVVGLMDSVMEEGDTTIPATVIFFGSGHTFWVKGSASWVANKLNVKMEES